MGLRCQTARGQWDGGAETVLTGGLTRIPEQLSRWYRGYLGRSPRGSLERSRHSRMPLSWIFDRLDERRARRFRTVLGRRQWLVSWEWIGDGCWLARLSCPSLATTLERTGRTRTRAIGRATRALTLHLTFRDELNRRTTRSGLDPSPPEYPWC
jgi:hypothetical protein